MNIWVYHHSFYFVSKMALPFPFCVFIGHHCGQFNIITGSHACCFTLGAGGVPNTTVSVKCVGLTLRVLVGVSVTLLLVLVGVSVIAGGVGGQLSACVVVKTSRMIAIIDTNTIHFFTLSLCSIFRPDTVLPHSLQLYK